MEEMKIITDAYVSGMSLEEYKTARYNAIDARTTELVLEGFTYAGIQFSLSPSAQTNITNTYLARDIMSYPIAWNSKDDTAVHNIQDATEVISFYGTALTTVRIIRDAGTIIKNNIRNATTIAEVSAIVDNR